MLVDYVQFAQTIGGVSPMQSVVSATALNDGRGPLALLRKYLSQNLERLLRDRELTQRAFAEKLGVTEALVSKWINERGFPSERLIERVAAALSVDPSELTRPPADTSDPVLKFLREQARARGYDLIKKS
jgi:DNA-binding transcriptional regulator YdaS (Cro superfamily)